MPSTVATRTPAAALAQRREAIHNATAKRTAIAERRRKLRTGGRVELAAVLHERPDELAHVLLVDLVRWAQPRYAASGWVQRVGRLAVAAGVNLTVPLGRASLVERAWLSSATRTAR